MPGILRVKALCAREAYGLNLVGDPAMLNLVGNSPLCFVHNLHPTFLSVRSCLWLARQMGLALFVHKIAHRILKLSQGVVIIHTACSLNGGCHPLAAVHLHV